LAYFFGDRLAEQHQHDAQAVLAAVNRGGQPVIGADASEGHDLPLAAPDRVPEQEVQFPRLIAPVESAGLVVALDPEFSSERAAKSL